MLVTYQVKQSAKTANEGTANFYSSQIIVLNGDSNEALRSGAGGGPVGSLEKFDNSTIQTFQQVYMTPSHLPKSLIVRIGLGAKSLDVKVPMK